MAQGSGDATCLVKVTAASADSITLTYGDSSQSLTNATDSSAITLTVDGMTDLTIVIAEDGKVSRTHVIHVADGA